jgi:hypothetical protein
MNYIIRMAKAADLYATAQTNDPFDWRQIRDERFAALVTAAERELCAKVCDEYAKNSSNPMNFAENCAAAIRARGNHD